MSMPCYDSITEESFTEPLLSLDVRPPSRLNETSGQSRWRPEGIYFEAQDQFSSRKQTAIAASKQALQRERRRNNQRRYRHKQIALTTNLEIETDHLRDEINQLKRHRSDIAASIPTKENVWYFVVEYFRLFRYGLRNVVRTPSRSTQNTQYNDQLSCVREAMLPDVLFNAEQGVDALIKHWMCVSLRFEDVPVELDEIKKGAADSLLATSTTSITIQERTLRSVFPHLCIDMDDSPLAKILVGQRIQMRGWTCFEWDPTFGRVTCITNVADLLTPLLKLVGNLESVSRIFDGALTSPSFQWKTTR
ncbi:hypothetical protein GN958_ATG04646 [Phytophthora infestans]|uniref:BZIP domain-containing protein n=1 Tax=Phytophthora infestans TaxID=4787 RepID=A0A8S9V018_PHYIN|nr:hypothetical protein GN958_ATG04646 [Phytophthora infestans]